MTTTSTITSLENVILLHLYYFAIISTRSTPTENGGLPGNQIGRSGVQVKKENESFTFVCSRSPQNLEFGHLTLLFCRGRQINVRQFKTLVQSDGFCSFLLFCGVVLSFEPKRVP